MGLSLSTGHWTCSLYVCTYRKPEGITYLVLIVWISNHTDKQKNSCNRYYKISMFDTEAFVQYLRIKNAGVPEDAGWRAKHVRFIAYRKNDIATHRIFRYDTQHYSSSIYDHHQFCQDTMKLPNNIYVPASKHLINACLNLFRPGWNGWNGTRLLVVVRSIPSCLCPF